MVPLHQSNELVFQICSNSHQQHKIPQDLILGRASLEGSISDNTMGKGQRRKSGDASFDSNFGNFNDNKKQKIRHREIERQRRQEMATLYVSLRSLLPLELIKGKRSISDHMNEAVNHINHLQKKIKELSSVRDELRKCSSLSTPENGSGSLNSSPPSYFTVHPCCGGVRISITSCSKDEGWPLSRVLELLLERGFTVASCVSTKVNEKLLLTIQSEVTEVSDSTSLDLSGLQEKLTVAIPSLRCIPL
ncbi:hypothetical protein CJ030_MR2G014092 [Morella rubra]|uniref:BHLH domain-containing protein n=1 Tax=Morella rubra TaxID=262757 RepID=A0A6A1WDA4_9ROSI|nr:hypothetical protein CJ030_MR2G014092 [Morella rubra]